MKVITAPNEYIPFGYDVLCFLAGGITNCPKWQDEVIKALKRAEDKGVNLDNLVILNPRRAVFPMDNVDAAEEQIRWEFNMLERCDIFSMYFSSGESVQPICMYELGRNIARMVDKRPLSWRERIAVSVEYGYKRDKDVLIQTKLAVGEDIVLENATPYEHAHSIIMCYTWLTEDL